MFAAMYFSVIFLTLASSCVPVVTLDALSADSGDGSEYGSDYGSGYGSGYGSDYGSGYGSDYGSGYGSDYGSGYGSDYGSGYGSDFGSGYGDSGYDGSDSYYTHENDEIELPEEER